MTGRWEGWAGRAGGSVESWVLAGCLRHEETRECSSWGNNDGFLAHTGPSPFQDPQQKQKERFPCLLSSEAWALLVLHSETFSNVLENYLLKKITLTICYSLDLNVPQRSCVKHLVPRVALLQGTRTSFFFFIVLVLELLRNVRNGAW
jgi:hypothetical protein